MASSIDTRGFETNAFDRGIRPILHIFSIDQAKQLVHYQPDAQLRQQIDELAAKCDDGQIGPDELAEYEGYVHANKFVAILQAQARKRLATQSSE
jgi:hypothetical protein